MIDKGQINDFLKNAQNELGQDILPFWIKNCQDDDPAQRWAGGGFIGRMSNDGTIAKDAPKGLVLNARILWTFSAAYRFKKNEEYLQMAKRAYDYIMQNFVDKKFGGAYWLLDHTGKAIDDSKEIYGQAFLIYGLSEYYLATADSAALEKAKEIFSLIEKHCHDDANKGYFETFSRDWKAAEKAMLATGDPREKKTMNTHLHLLEAYTNLYRAWKDEKLKARLNELIEVFQGHIINAETFHFKLFFDEQWHSTNNIVSFGHDIEGSWLLTEAAEVLGQPNRATTVREWSLKMAQAVYEQGLDGDGGLFYEGKDGKIINSDKEWWPQAETVVGFLNAYQLSGQEKFLRAALKYILPTGLFGGFAGFVLFAFMSTHTSYLLAWGGTLVQDVIIPVRNKRFEPRQHMMWIRISIIFVALFIVLFSTFYPLNDRIFMFLDLTGGLFLSGCSVVLLGGLYFKRGTITAAFTSMITGIVLTISGFIYRIYDPEFLNGTVMSFYIALICIAEFVSVSFLTKDVNIDLNELLNRRKEDIEARKNLKWYQLSPEVPRGDRILIPCMYAAIALFIIGFIGTWIYNSFVDIPTEKWMSFWHGYICAMFGLGGIFLLWVITGGFRDLFRLFKNLKIQKVDVTDDGRVTSHHTENLPNT